MAEKTSVYGFIAISLFLFLACHFSTKLHVIVYQKVNKKPMSDQQRYNLTIQNRIALIVFVALIAIFGKVDWSF